MSGAMHMPQPAHRKSFRYDPPGQFTCSLCEDYAHTVSPKCRCNLSTPLLEHIRTCVIPCSCAAGVRLKEEMDITYPKKV